MSTDYLGPRIRNLRKAMQMSQKDLAEILGLSRSAVASYENGARYPDYSTLVKIASYFQVSVDYLLGIDQKSNKSYQQYDLLEEIAQMLDAAPIDPEEKQLVLKEISDYFKWKLYLAQHPDRKE
ncbi:MAG TPA: helix-turn-helix transcriptional regulator [Syntrophomonadaceae bacterium]|nr:helix-turn-helix transcriptional regulator [Syntrophomonadaceae bacterium]